MLALFSALPALQLHARSALSIHGASAAGVRGAAAVMSDETRDSNDWANADLLARLRAPIRQFDGGWADTADRYHGKKDTNVNGEKIQEGKFIGTGGGLRLDTDVGGLGGSHHEGPTLPEEKQAQCVLPEESFKVEKMAMSQTDEDIVIECDLSSEQEAEAFIDIEPMFLTKEEYFYGFTADSSSKIYIDHGMSSDIEGEMNAKEHASKLSPSTSTLGSMEGRSKKDKRRIMIKLKFDPEYEAGEFEAYLCFIFPREKNFSRFYKITGKSTK